jgi:hypothetical protein
MPEQKDPPPSEPKTSNPEEIIAVPPEILKKIKWLILYGKRHWLLVSIGAIAVVGGPLVSRYWVEPAIFVRDKLDTKLAEKTVTIAKGLRLHFRHSRETGSTDFREAEDDIKSLFNLDPQNGHAWYFSGEVRRLKNPNVFTDKSCIRTPLASDSAALDTYRNDFYRYLEDLKTVSSSEAGGDTGSETCYERPSGYCPQRTAWIHHLLANDLYAEASIVADQNFKREKLTHALQHANTAVRLFPGGFEQCMPTRSVVVAATADLASLPGGGPKRR